MHSPTTVHGVSPASSERPRWPGPVGRRVGYAIGVVVDVVLLALVNVWPGWQAVPVLTHDMDRVLPLLNASFIVGAAVNLVLFVLDRREAKAVGDIVTTVVGLAVLTQLWQVFPFDFGSVRFDATVLTRVVLGFAVFGTAIALVVQFVMLVSVLIRAATHHVD